MVWVENLIELWQGKNVALIDSYYMNQKIIEEKREARSLVTSRTSNK